ncbi:MAG: hypothetical protein DDT32_01478 [Syntrophomonadaceae bacterium]|nr:hypothetical protein [Bacillota bacterium]MBT9147713.1 hypothetical protein [Bacillota bacterium]
MKQDRDTSYPVVSQKVVLRKEGEDRFLCIDPDTGAAAIVNRRGVMILEGIRKNGGEYNVAEIIERFETAYREKGTDINNMSDDLYAFLLRCHELGLISFYPEKGGGNR